MAIKSGLPRARPMAHANIDARRRALARAVVDGQDVHKAGAALGFGSDGLKQALEHAAFAMAVRTEIQRKLATVTAPQALAVLSELMLDKSVMPHVRRQAASDILDRSGFIPPKSDTVRNGAEIATLSDMSTDALAAMVARLESELSERARPVQDVSGPISAPLSDNPLKGL